MTLYALWSKRKLIKARRLFLVPALSMFLLMLPFGFTLVIIILGIWYSRNSDDIKSYFRGYEFRMNETSFENNKKWV